MCDRYSDEYGYICSDCFAELVRLGPTHNIEHFMTGEPLKGVDEDTSRQYFDEIFPDCDTPETATATRTLSGDPWPRGAA